MNRFEEKKEIARQLRRDMLARRGDSSVLLANELTELIERGLNQEQWKEASTLFEYDPSDLTIVESNREANVQSSPYFYTYSRLKTSLNNARNNKGGFLRDEQKVFARSGEEPTDLTVNVGQIGDKFCIISDHYYKAILSPLFDTLVKVTDDYIDVEFDNNRFRITSGTYDLPKKDYTNKTPREKYLSLSSEIPDCLSIGSTIKVSLLEREEINAMLPTISPEIVENEYPDNDAHVTFQSIQGAVLSYIKSQPSTPQLVDQLRDVDKALQLPAVPLDNQVFNLTLRTSETADVLFFHNTSIRSNQDQLADAMFHMSTEEFLSLAMDDERRERLVADTLGEVGFYFVRQHDGQIFIMDHSQNEESIITPNLPYFPDILRKVEDKLAEYFAAVETRTPNSVPLRMSRHALAQDLEKTIPKKDQIPKTKWQKVAHWLLYK